MGVTKLNEITGIYDDNKTCDEFRGELQQAYFESKSNKGKSLEEIDCSIRNKYFSKNDFYEEI